MKQMFLSWGDDFTIQDAEGRDAYFIVACHATAGDADGGWALYTRGSR